MSIEVKIPASGESVTGGLLAKWRVANGATVTKGQPLFDFETDKVTLEGNSEADGVISITVAEGTEVLVHQVVATIAAGAAGAPAAAKAAPAAAVSAPAASSGKDASGEISPAVRANAANAGIDPATVAGTGKDGRVTKGDILAAPAPVAAAPAAAAPAPAPKAAAAPVAAGVRTSRRKMTPLRKKIAERLVQAKSEAAMLTTFNEVNMAPVMELRKKYQDEFTKKHGVKLGFMSFFVRACVQALKDVPAINAQIDGDEIVDNHFYDIGVAVGTEKGLIVPVLRNPDTKSLAQIEGDILAYAKKARDGKIGIDDLQGGVFTITNGGIYGSMLSTPIINAPQSAILGMHNIVERAVVENGQIVIRPIMYLALSYDHRLVDGKEAVTFLVKVKQLLEDPARLVLSL
jgi:2-oxoglutarate dehydrogenase E2 component (dihydrolipoamide succinyltransferase)